MWLQAKECWQPHEVARDKEQNRSSLCREHSPTDTLTVGPAIPILNFWLLVPRGNNFLSLQVHGHLFQQPQQSTESSGNQGCTNTLPCRPPPKSHAAQAERKTGLLSLDTLEPTLGSALGHHRGGRKGRGQRRCPATTEAWPGSPLCPGFSESEYVTVLLECGSY